MEAGCSKHPAPSFFSIGPTRQRFHVSKLGDSKPCVVCGGVATLLIVQPSLATRGWVDDRSIPYDIPPMPMWQCEECDERQAADDFES
jgi:hypothetical protein